MNKKILMPIVAIALACAILLGAYNGLLGVRQARDAAELTAKM